MIHVCVCKEVKKIKQQNNKRILSHNIFSSVKSTSVYTFDDPQSSILYKTRHTEACDFN